MANIFLDTNYFIDIFERDQTKISDLSNKQVFVSPLSYHIYSYVNKISVPNPSLIASLSTISIVSLDQTILNRALIGPTRDLEDNIQLQSAAEANCEHFLTHDKALLKMGYFGKTKISKHL